MDSAFRRRALLTDFMLLAATVTVVLGLTHTYVARERFFYFWDQAHYQSIAERTASAFQVSFKEGFDTLRLSYRDDYNALFALPLVPWLTVFGASRMSYEMGLALVYQAPLILSWGAVAAHLVLERRRAAFWGAVLLALLTPMTWVPALRGFPDAAAATAMALALCLYLRDPGFEKGANLFLIGGLLALSVLIRRHFAYAVVAYFFAAGICALVDALGTPQPARERARLFGRRAGRLVLIANAGVIVAVAVAYQYVLRLITFDFTALYTSYENPVETVGNWYLEPYGWIAVWLAAMGWVFGRSVRSIPKDATRFVLLWGVALVAQWLLHVRQLGVQYTLHVTPLIVFGWLLLCATIVDRLSGTPARLLLSLIVGLGATNLVLGLTTLGPQDSFALESLFAGTRAPLVRPDYAEVTRLTQFLRTHSPSPDGVFVVGSSPCLNPDIVRQADVALEGRRPGSLDVFSVPNADSDGYYPMGKLLRARYVVLARPFQHHLPVREQEIVKSVYDLFDRGSPLASDFEAVPGFYRLENCTVSLYRRQRPTTRPAALDALDRMQAAVAVRPGMQPDWVVVEGVHPSWLSRNPDGSADWVAHPAARDARPSTTLMALAPLTGDRRVSARVGFHDSRCQGLTLSFHASRGGTAMVPVAEVRRRPGEAESLDLLLPTHGFERLYLKLLDYGPGISTDYCLVALQGLTLTPAPEHVAHVRLPEGS